MQRYKRSFHGCLIIIHNTFLYKVLKTQLYDTIYRLFSLYMNSGGAILRNCRGTFDRKTPYSNVRALAAAACGILRRAKQLHWRSVCQAVFWGSLCTRREYGGRKTAQYPSKWILARWHKNSVVATAQHNAQALIRWTEKIVEDNNPLNAGIRSFICGLPLSSCRMMMINLGLSLHDFEVSRSSSSFLTLSR